jgi:hypothetical protein
MPETLPTQQGSLADRPATARSEAGGTAGHGRSDLFVGATTSAALLVLQLVRNGWIRSGSVVLAGDQAIQQLIGRDAIVGRELRGIYSRVGFHHPGPGFAYVWGLGDAVARVVPFPGGPSTPMLLANAVLLSALLGASVAIVRSHLSSWSAALVILAALALTTWTYDGALASSWVPQVTGVAVLLLLVAAASAATGRPGSLWALAAATGFALASHVAMVSFVAAVLVVAAMVGWRTGAWKSAWLEHRRTAAGAGCLLVAMLTPTALHTLTDWPGELSRYAKFAGQTEPNPLGEAVRFTLDYWPSGRQGTEGAIAVLAFAALAAVAWWRSSKFAWAVVAVAGAGEIALTYYAARGVDDLSYNYLGLFSVSLPGLVIGAAAATAVAPWLPDTARGRQRVAQAAVAAACAIALVVTPGLRGAAASPRVDEAATDLAALLRLAGSTHLAVYGKSGEIQQFLWMPALVVVAQDNGVDVCLTGPGWDLKAPPSAACTAKDLRTATKLVAVPSPDGDGVFGPLEITRVQRFPTSTPD